MDEALKPTLRAAFVFAVHVVVAGLLFLLIAAMATGLAWLAHYLQQVASPVWVVYGLQTLEVLLFIVDGACFMFLVAVEALKFCRAIWAGREGSRNERPI